MAPSRDETPLDDQEYEPSPGPDSTSNTKSSSGSGSGSDEDQKHHNQVQGGIKAAISNPRVSDEKKEELKERLD